MGALAAQVVLEFTRSGLRFDHKLTCKQPLASLPHALMHLTHLRLIGIQLHDKSDFISNNVGKKTTTTHFS